MQRVTPPATKLTLPVAPAGTVPESVTADPNVGADADVKAVAVGVALATVKVAVVVVVA